MTRERKRRQYGSGSVYQRGSDGRWLGVIQAGWNTNGTRRTITVSAKTEAEAKRRLAAKQKQIAKDGLPASSGAERVTVKAWADLWLAQIVTKVRPSAFNADRVAVTRWIVPTIGHKRLVDLTPGDIRAVSAAVRKSGAQTSTALRYHVTLTKMLKAAMLEGYAVPPRVLLVDRPGINANDRQAMPVADAVALLGAAVELLPHSSLYAARLLQGMRQGECLGLTWAAVDTQKRYDDEGNVVSYGKLDISWQLQPLPYLDKKDHGKGFRVPDDYEATQLVGRYHLTRPKTARGQRIIPLVPWMAKALEAWRKVAPKSTHDLVWPAPDGAPRNAADDLAEWKWLQGQVGVAHPSGRPYVGHEARHTTATLLLELGVDRSVIEQILGQSKLVESYLHTNEKQTADALALLAGRLMLGTPKETE